MARFSRHKVIRLKLEQPLPRKVFARYGEVRELLSEDTAWEVALEVPKERAKAVAQDLLGRFPVQDIVIEEPDLEEVLRTYFQRRSS